MNDVHYYLEGWIPAFVRRGADVTCFVSGGLFAKFPGTYTLPAGDGLYSIEGCLEQTRVTMHTRTAGQDYSHDLVTIANPDVRIDYGWYSHFATVIPG